jgi:hypothetical protein
MTETSIDRPGTKVLRAIYFYSIPIPKSYLRPSSCVMKHPLSIIFVVLVISLLLVNFPFLAIVDASGNWGLFPGIYIYLYLLWIILIVVYYLLSRKAGE